MPGIACIYTFHRDPPQGAPGERLKVQLIVAINTPMEVILGSLREGFGGAEGWLREHGWADNDLARLRSHLRTPSTPAADGG